MSKDLFLMMREQEIQTQNFLPNDKEIQFSATEFIKGVLDAGESDKVELFAQAKRMSVALDTITPILLNSLPQENFEGYGLKGAYRNGGDSINYKEDLVWCEFQKQLKDREELIKLAQKQDVFDAYGNEVPKVSTTPRKSSLSITFIK